MPAKRSAPGARQDQRPQRRADLQAVAPLSGGVEHAPQCPPGLLKASRDTWAAFWREPVAKAGEQIDRVVVERWIFAYDEWRRALNAMRKARVVKGSTGQPSMNPLAGWVKSREEAMRACEVQLGVGLKNRADLGITMGQAQMTAQQLNAMTEEEPDGVIDAEEAEVLEEFKQAR